MQAMSDRPKKPPLASIDLEVPGSTGRGRAFVPSSAVGTVDVEGLRSYLGTCFIEEDDESRMPLLRKALEQRAVVFETFPGETPPVEVHAYVLAPDVSESPIFACVLASLDVVEHLVAAPPHVVLETATLQVIDAEASPASVVVGLEAWIRRVWPDLTIPRIKLHQWPDVAIWSPEVPALAMGLPLVRSSNPMPAPAAQWSRQEFVPVRPGAPQP
jgi:hypothetical protein